MNEKDRLAFVMRYVREFSVKETATAIGWSEVKVRVNLPRVN
ncbi:MAG: hypothetical protein K6T83_01870 [Alicyclobacillus sp.]|nr:hypothetical protein [Alicyclobacillus sp.]